MTIANLAGLLDHVAPNRPLWINADQGRLVAEQIRRISVVDQQFCGARVAIETDSSLELAKCLVALDGICEAIILLPTGLDQEQKLELKEQAGVNRIVSVCPTTGSDATVARRVETHWILATSGTTGTPKLVQHTLASLTRTASFDLEIGGQHVWSSLYNLTGFAGLQVFLQAWCGGSQFVLHDDDASLSERVSRMIDHGVTALSATPTMWRKMLMASDVNRMPLRRITLGGEISDQKILDALAATFPDAKIRQIYASTEAGVGFSVRDGVAGFPSSYLTGPPAGIELRVEDDHLLIRGSKMNQRLIGNYVNLHRDDGFIDTGDRVNQNGDRFEFLGRANGSINVGGNKVQPEEVERFLLGLEGVVESRVYAKKSPFTGSLVVADVVSDSQLGHVELRKQIVGQCRKSLELHKVPAMIRVVESIDTNAAGKVLRNAG